MAQQLVARLHAYACIEVGRTGNRRNQVEAYAPGLLQASTRPLTASVIASNIVENKDKRKYRKDQQRAKKDKSNHNDKLPENKETNMQATKF